MQNLINELAKGWRASRSLSQMTLYKFISLLETFPKDKQIENIGEPHSYRGYYSDLAFEKLEGTISVEDLLKILKNDCLSKTYTGYKGGDFFMDVNTPLWIAKYGCCGVKIIDIVDNDILTLSTAEDE